MVFTTTETTGTTVGTGAKAGCHEVTYNWDNKITVVNSFSLSTVVFFQTTTETTGTTVERAQRLMPQSDYNPHILKKMFFGRIMPHIILNIVNKKVKIPTSPGTQTKKICKFVKYMMTKEEAQNVSSHQTSK